MKIVVITYQHGYEQRFEPFRLNERHSHFYSFRLGLDKDNPSHRNLSNQLDAKCGDSGVYNKIVRPVVHGTYHAARFVNSGNPEELARAKDQISKFGTGQQHTDYLKAHRSDQNAKK